MSANSCFSCISLAKELASLRDELSKFKSMVLSNSTKERPLSCSPPPGKPHETLAINSNHCLNLTLPTPSDLHPNHPLHPSSGVPTSLSPVFPPFIKISPKSSTYRNTHNDNKVMVALEK